MQSRRTSLVGRPERPEYILLEASGVAEPSGIWLTFTADCFRDRIRMDSIMCIVDDHSMNGRNR